MINKAEISWYTTPVGAEVGYGYAAVEIIQSLQRKNIKVSYRANDPKVFINFILPDYYKGGLDQFKIGYGHMESSGMSDNWPSLMNQMDEIWAASSYVENIFKENNVNDVIRLIPHGINPEVWKINNRFVADQFVFMHVGGPTERKGGQKVADAFMKVFGKNKDVKLIMKSNGDSEARYYDDAGSFFGIYKHPRVRVVQKILEVDELAELYQSAHCMVYPTNGEGFGLIPFQAIATGMPTICTNATGCADFAEMSVPLDSHPAKAVGVHRGEWVEPDFDDLCDKMLYVYNNYDAIKEKTLHAANIIHTTQTWDHMTDLILDVLGDRIYERV